MVQEVKSRTDDISKWSHTTDFSSVSLSCVETGFAVNPENGIILDDRSEYSACLAVGKIYSRTSHLTWKQWAVYRIE